MDLDGRRMLVMNSESSMKAGASAPSWRRIAGAIIMICGALPAIAFTVLAVVVGFTFVEWRNALDGLISIALVSVPPIFGGLAFMALGRWAFGDWRDRAPIASTTALVLPIAGVIAAFAAIILFVMALFNETGRGGAWVVGQFVASILASFAAVAAGILIRPRQAED